MSSQLLDPRVPFQPNMPQEWGDIPQEILEMIIPASAMEVEGPDGKIMVYSAGMMTPDQKLRLDALAANRWFLLKNDGPTGYALRCGKCKRKHLYFTLACIERPFNGLQQIVGLMRRWEREGRDLELSCIRLGTIEPIFAKKALKLRQKIRDHGEEPDEVPTVAGEVARAVARQQLRAPQPRVIRLS